MVTPQINREKTCPFLLRVFYKENEAVPIESLKDREPVQKEDEVRVYTWMDATLREIVEQLKVEIPNARRRDAQFDLNLAITNLTGGLEYRNIGTIHSTRRGNLDTFTLHRIRLVIGDYLAVGIKYNLK